MKNITNKSLKKYVKHMFGLDVDIKILKRVRIDGIYYGGYATIIGDKKIIRIAEKDKHRMSLLWHEVGHLITDFDHSATENEYNAQMWAIDTAWRRNCHKVFLELISDTYYIWKECKNSIYARARKKILKEIKKKYKANFEYTTEAK